MVSTFFIRIFGNFGLYFQNFNNLKYFLLGQAKLSYHVRFN